MSDTGKQKTTASQPKVKIDLSVNAFFLNLEQWGNVDFSSNDNSVLVGTQQNAIIRPGTKNLVVAPEKKFKTTVLLRLAIGMACGYTVYPSLPIARSASVLYIYGEMIPKELEERTLAAKTGIPVESLALGSTNFVGGRSIAAHLIKDDRQKEIRRVVKQFKPEVLIIDPWQEFITGHDENSFKDTSQATDFLNKLIVEQGGMTVFLVVHTGKDHQKGRGDTRYSRAGATRSSRSAAAARRGTIKRSK
jgi:RecA-family ATPase